MTSDSPCRERRAGTTIGALDTLSSSPRFVVKLICDGGGGFQATCSSSWDPSLPRETRITPTNMIPAGTALQLYLVAMPHLHLALIFVVIVAHLCCLSSRCSAFEVGGLEGGGARAIFFGWSKLFTGAAALSQTKQSGGL
jgi:hypothetical protein